MSKFLVYVAVALAYLSGAPVRQTPYEAFYGQVQAGTPCTLYVGDAPLRGDRVYTTALRVPSLPGSEPGVYDCFVRDGKPMMESIPVLRLVLPPFRSPFRPSCPGGVCPK